MEKIIMTIIGAIFIIIAYLIGLNQNRKEKEYYKKEYQYYRNEYFYLKLQKCDKTYKNSLERGNNGKGRSKNSG